MVKSNDVILRVLIGVVTISVVIVTLVGIFYNSGIEPYEFETLHGDTVLIYGRGLYKNETYSLGLQTRAQDAVTLLVCLPLLLISFIKMKNSNLKWQLIFLSAFGYFMYTYMMFMLIAYNKMFLLYILIFASSLYAFIISFSRFYERDTIMKTFNNKIPNKTIGIYLIISGMGLAVRWLADIFNSLANKTVPNALAHYTTPLVYALDLSIVVPAFFVTAVLLIMHKPLGYFMASIMIIKGLVMWISLTAMTIMLVVDGNQLGTVDLLMAPAFAIITAVFLYLIIRQKNFTEGVS